MSDPRFRYPDVPQDEPSLPTNEPALSPTNHVILAYPKWPVHAARHHYFGGITFPDRYPLGRPNPDEPDVLPISDPSIAPASSTARDWLTREDFTFNTFAFPPHFWATLFEKAASSYSANQLALLWALFGLVPHAGEHVRYLTPLPDLPAGQTLASHDSTSPVGKALWLHKDWLDWLRCDHHVELNCVPNSLQVTTLEVREVNTYGTLAWWRAQAVHSVLQEIGLDWADPVNRTLNPLEDSWLLTVPNKAIPVDDPPYPGKQGDLASYHNAWHSSESIPLGTPTSNNQWDRHFTSVNYKGPSWGKSSQPFPRSLLAIHRRLMHAYYHFRSTYSKESFLDFLLASTPQVTQILNTITASDATILLILHQQIRAEGKHRIYHAGDELSLKRLQPLNFFGPSPAGQSPEAIIAATSPALYNLIWTTYRRLLTSLVHEVPNIQANLERSHAYRYALENIVGRPWQQIYFITALDFRGVTLPTLPKTFLNVIPLAHDDALISGQPCSLCQENFSLGFVLKPHHCNHLNHPECFFRHLATITTSDIRRQTCGICRHPQQWAAERAGLPLGFSGFRIGPAEQPKIGEQEPGPGTRRVGIMHIPDSTVELYQSEPLGWKQVSSLIFAWRKRVEAQIYSLTQRNRLEWSPYKRLMTPPQDPETLNQEQAMRDAAMERGRAIVREAQNRNVRERYIDVTGQRQIWNRTSSTTDVRWVYDHESAFWEPMYVGGYQRRPAPYTDLEQDEDQVPELRHGVVLHDSGDGRIVQYNAFLGVWESGGLLLDTSVYKIDPVTGVVEHPNRPFGEPYDGQVELLPTTQNLIIYNGIRREWHNITAASDAERQLLIRTSGQKRWRRTRNGLVDTTPTLDSPSLRVPPPQLPVPAFTPPPNGFLVNVFGTPDIIHRWDASINSWVEHEHQRIGHKIKTHGTAVRDPRTNFIYRLNARTMKWILPLNQRVLAAEVLSKPPLILDYSVLQHEPSLSQRDYDRMLPDDCHNEIENKFAELNAIPLADQSRSVRHTLWTLRRYLASTSLPDAATILLQGEDLATQPLRGGSGGIEDVEMHDAVPRPNTPIFDANGEAVPSSHSARDLQNRRYRLLPTGWTHVGDKAPLAEIMRVCEWKGDSWDRQTPQEDHDITDKSWDCPFESGNMALYPVSLWHVTGWPDMKLEPADDESAPMAVDCHQRFFYFRRPASQEVDRGYWYFEPEENVSQDWWSPLEHQPIFHRVAMYVYTDDAMFLYVVTYLGPGFLDIGYDEHEWYDGLVKPDEGTIGSDQWGIQYELRYGTENQNRMYWFNIMPYPDDVQIAPLTERRSSTILDGWVLVWSHTTPGLRQGDDWFSPRTF